MLQCDLGVERRLADPRGRSAWTIALEFIRLRMTARRLRE
jgi:hypothetical protein